jgi:predicted TIM-barrel fold metal-dependent hydrolase
LPPHRIDTHHHIFPPKYLAAEQDRIVNDAPIFKSNMLGWSPQRSIEVMDAAGVATAITSITSPGVWFGDTAKTRRLARDCNEYAADLVRDHKGRFGAFASLPLPDIDACLAEIDYAFGTLKADGIGLVTSIGDKYPGDPAFAPVFDELNRRKATVYFHPKAAECCFNLMPGVPGPTLEFPFDTTRAIISLAFNGAFSRYRDITFIFSHAGGTLPMLAPRVAGQVARRPDLKTLLPNGLMHEFARLYYDIVSATHPIQFNAIRGVTDISHLLFGSDFPFWDPQVTVDGVRALNLSAADLAALERDNALRILPTLREKAGGLTHQQG